MGYGSDSRTTVAEIRLGEVQAALEAAEPLQVVAKAGDSAWATVRRGDSIVEVRDDEQWQPNPARTRGTLKVLTAEGFSRAWRRHGGGEAHGSNVYVDEDRCRLIGVLNDDQPGAAGWRDHLISLDLRSTPEWKLWVDGQGLGPQARFAETVEAGELEIKSPSAAEMRDLAANFYATVNATVKRAVRLSDGRTQLVYDEEVEAKAGAAGELVIPDEFMLALRPFVGSARYEVRARLRYRVSNKQFTIGYHLHRPEEIRRLAFNDVVEAVAADIGVDLIAGVPDGAPEGR